MIASIFFALICCISSEDSWEIFLRVSSAFVLPSFVPCVHAANTRGVLIYDKPNAHLSGKKLLFQRKLVLRFDIPGLSEINQVLLC